MNHSYVITYNINVNKLNGEQRMGRCQTTVKKYTGFTAAVFLPVSKDSSAIHSF